MGLLDSLAQILPYAIPAAAGAALGGPGLAMVGAGGAAQAQNQNLNKQIEIANLLNESQYRNADLGLRRQEIQTNEAIRKQALQQSGQQHSETLAETRLRDKERADEQARADRRDHEFHNDMMASQAEQHRIELEGLQTRDEEKRAGLKQQAYNLTSTSIQRAQDKLKDKAKEAWKHLPVGDRALAFAGLGKDADYDDWEKQYVAQHLPQVLKLSGITPEKMAQQGFDLATIADNFPDYNPMSAPTAAAPAVPAAAPSSGARPPVQVGATINAPNGSAKVTAVNMDGSLTIQYANGKTATLRPPKGA